MKTLSKVVLAALMLLMVTGNLVKAQDVEITDQDLKDYAIILLAQKSITDKISPMVNDLIEKQEGMTGNRYTELDKIAKGDASKLTGAQEWEANFYELVQKRVAKKKKAAKTVVSTLATNGLGAKKYKAIKAKMKSDANAKSKVDAIVAELSAKP